MFAFVFVLLLTVACFCSQLVTVAAISSLYATSSSSPPSLASSPALTYDSSPKTDSLPLPPGTVNSGSCPDGPPLRWASQLDAASKALLAPIVFNGKLISLSEDYGGRVAITFRVLKQIKNIGSRHGTVPVNLLIGTQVTLYFVTGSSSVARSSEPPHCAAFLNSSQFELLRPDGKYIVFAAAPLTSLVELHRTQLRRQLSSVAAAHHSVPPSSAPLASIGLQLVQLQQLYANYLSAFAAPDLLNKRSSRSMRRVLCQRCGKFCWFPFVRLLSTVRHHPLLPPHKGTRP